MAVKVNVKIKAASSYKRALTPVPPPPGSFRETAWWAIRI